MKKIILIALVVSVLSACQFLPQGDYIRPSDILADRDKLMGTVVNVTGFVVCNGDFCQVYEKKSRIGIPEGARVGLKIDKLPHADKKFFMNDCTMSAKDMCTLKLTGQLKKGALPSTPDIQVTAIQKLGVTGLLGSF